MDVECRLLVGMITPVSGDPVPESSFIYGDLPSDLGIGREFIMTAFTASSLNSGENFRRFRGTRPHFLAETILVDLQSEKFGAPHVSAHPRPGDPAALAAPP